MTTVNENAYRKSCNVLLIDDNPDMATLVKAYLKDPKVRITVSCNGREGVEAFKNDTFDLVLMDVQMPELDGYEATRAIRFWERQKDLRPTPIAALTACSATETLIEVYLAGCTQYLTKPISKNVLLQTLAQYVSASRRVGAAKPDGRQPQLCADLP
jgi:CheY-like chemotaxis protein